MSEIDGKNMFHPPNHQYCQLGERNHCPTPFKKFQKKRKESQNMQTRMSCSTVKPGEISWKLSVNQTQDFLCPVKGEYLITRSCFFKLMLLKISACQIVQCETYTVEDKKTTTVTTIPLN
jgi:hypothetical protein